MHAAHTLLHQASGQEPGGQALPLHIAAGTPYTAKPLKHAWRLRAAQVSPGGRLEIDPHIMFKPDSRGKRSEKEGYSFLHIITGLLCMPQVLNIYSLG